MCIHMMCYPDLFLLLFLCHFNFVGQLGTMGVGWRLCSKDTGAKFVSKLAHTLWYLDTYHEKFAGQGIHIPEHFMGYKRIQ